MAVTLYEPDLTVIDDVFEPGLAVAVEDGGIIAVGPRADMKRRFFNAAAVDWSGMALLPGTVNAHNHPFLQSRVTQLLARKGLQEPLLRRVNQRAYARLRYSQENAVSHHLPAVYDDPRQRGGLHGVHHMGQHDIG